MTKEQKQLLLVDLCSRLPYGVICEDIRHGDSVITEIDVKNKLAYLFDVDEYIKIDNIKPYLRPMSSMTEEEKEELSHYDNAIQRADFFYSHHIDCRGLIPLGLALEAKESMYNLDK